MAKRGIPGRRQRRQAEIRQKKIERRTRTEHTWVVPVLAVAFLLSGGAGLIHEVVWARLLGHLFGVTSLAISTVLAAFMGGLAIGSYWLGKRSDRFADGRRIYALLELGIGAFALLVPFLLDWIEPLYGWIWRRFHLSFAAFSVLRFIVAGAILLVPTIMMGATLPVLAHYLAGLRGRKLAPQWLYTMNLVGAVVGVVAAGFVLMPMIGVWGTLIFGAAVNIIVAAVVLRLPAVAREEAPPAEKPVPAEAGPVRLLLAAAFLSGLISLATQVVWTRVLVLVVGSTTYSFSAVLLVYLVALGAGAAWASRRGTRVSSVVPDLAVMHLLAAACMLGALYAVNSLPHWFLQLYQFVRPETLGGAVAVKTAVIFAVLCLPVLCAGTILPLAMIGVLPPDARGTGPAVGRIYAINTVGSIAGAILGGFAFIPLFGSRSTLLGLSAAAAAMGVTFALTGKRPRWLLASAAAGAALVLAGVLTQPRWNYQDLHTGVFEPARLRVRYTGLLSDPSDQELYYREGQTASVLVVERPDKVRLMLINARTNASDDPTDMGTQVMLAQIPILLAPRPEEVFVVGWGSGVTVGSAAQSPAKRVTAVEIEPAVVEGSRFFEHVNHEPLRDPRVRLYEDDARHILLASEDVYDVIISEPPHPWASGIANLFTRDFYLLAARRLRPDGVFAQWLQSYQISIATYRSIVAAFHSVFPEVMIFNPPDSTDTILVGSRRSLRLDLEELDRRWQHGATRADLARIGITRPESLLASLYIGPDAVDQLARNARVNTDNNMVVEFNGPRDMAGTSRRALALLDLHETPIEQMLTDPSALTENRERLRALIRELERQGRHTEYYKQLLKRLE